MYRNTEVAEAHAVAVEDVEGMASVVPFTPQGVRVTPEAAAVFDAADESGFYPLCSSGDAESIIPVLSRFVWDLQLNENRRQLKRLEMAAADLSERGEGLEADPLEIVAAAVQAINDELPACYSLIDNAGAGIGICSDRRTGWQGFEAREIDQMMAAC